MALNMNKYNIKVFFEKSSFTKVALIVMVDPGLFGDVRKSNLYLKSDAVDVVLQVEVDPDPLFSDRTKFVPKKPGMPKVRQIARIFSSEVDPDPLFSDRTKFVPKKPGMPKVRQIARIFSSDLNNTGIFT